MLSRTPNVIQARPRGYPEQNTPLLLHSAITWMQSAFYLLLTLTHTEIIFKDPLLASKIGWFYKVFWLYICLYVYIQWYYTNQLTLPSTLVFQSASPILTCFLCMAQYVLSTGSLSVQSSCKSPRSSMWCHSRSTSKGEDPFVKVFFAGSSVQNMENLYYYPSIQHISVLKFVPSLHSDPTLNYTTNWIEEFLNLDINIT